MTNETIEEQIRSLERRILSLEDLLVTKPEKVIPNSKSMSPKEFLLDKKLKTDTQKLLTLGYFLEHEMKISSFNVPDLENIFRSAKEKPPKNINDTVNKNIARGFIMEASEKKENKKSWVLTSTGEDHVEYKLQKN